MAALLERIGEMTRLVKPVGVLECGLYHAEKFTFGVDWETNFLPSLGEKCKTLSIEYPLRQSDRKVGGRLLRKARLRKKLTTYKLAQGLIIKKPATLVDVQFVNQADGVTELSMEFAVKES